MSDPTNHDQAISRESINAAATRISRYVRHTPTLDIQTPHGALQVKLETLQLSGTFKARGAFNSLLQARAEGRSRVCAASGGNHGVAVACAASALQIDADIFVPEVSPAAKREAIASYGAQIHIGGQFYAEAAQACAEFAQQHDAMVCHAYDQPGTLQGQGTLAREWQQQSPELDTVLVAVGGGGLIGGMAAWYQDDVRIIAVETHGCTTLHNALLAGQPTDITVSGLAADSLGARRIGELVFPIAQRYVDASLLVSDDSVRAARQWAWENLRVALEPGGATALAAWLDGTYQADGNERVGVLLCGANTSAPPDIAATAVAP